jgi:hypothetical protein
LNRSLGGSQAGVGAFGDEEKLLPLSGSVLRQNTYMNYVNGLGVDRKTIIKSILEE